VSGKRSLIRAGTTVDQMVRAIGDRIVTGFLRPGEKLDEASLAARFDVSRTPVRESRRGRGSARARQSAAGGAAWRFAARFFCGMTV